MEYDLLNPDDLKDLRSIALVVPDSLRWDSFQLARKPVLDKWARRQVQRYSYASWTQPSHLCLLSGLLPHQSAAHVPAAATYVADHGFWATALAGDPSAKRHLFPEFCLPLMAQRCGWRTLGRVSMPVLNENTMFSRGFDDYSLSPPGSNLGTQIESLSCSPISDRTFVFINAGETHYPYLLPKSRMPRISGVHGALTRQWETDESTADQQNRFTAEDMAMMHKSQIKAMELVDRRLELLFELLPRPLLLLLVSDHGELFGEEGFFGHGPFFHRLLFEVPVAAAVIG